MPTTDPPSPDAMSPGPADAVPAAIQPHGALILCDPDSLAITHVSRNLAKITGWTGVLFPGIAAAAVLGRDLLHDLRNAATRAVATGGPGVVMGARIGAAERICDVTIHRHDDRVLIEIEPRPANTPAPEAILDMARQLIARVSRAPDPDRLLSLAARLAQVLLGHDRVMICRLLPTGAAEVVAEARAPGLPACLGREFPAADFPAQAPQTSRDAPLRMIADGAGAPVPLDPLVAAGAGSVDLTHAQLRSATPQEDAFLHDLDAAAMLSIPLVVDGAAWGLIACLDAAPRVTPLPQRIAAGLFGDCLALRIEAAERRRDAAAAAEERARDARRGRILNDELNHRVKNVIAVVRAIALQTGSGAATVAAYVQALQGRLDALAVAHDQSLGQGGGGIADLIETETGLHRAAGRPDRVTATGPALRLDDRAFGATALALHEMMTNAAKYGALSVPDGRLAVSWEVDADGDLTIAWQESGGPAVAPPTGTGFGTRLIRSVMEYDLRGAARIDYRPDGVAARFMVPARHVAAAAARPAVGAPRAAPQVRALAGMTVLVVEDQGLIAMDAEDTLRRLGAADVRLAATTAEAEALLRGPAPDLVLLDVNLGDETAESLAATLRQRGLTFALMTGYADPETLPPALRDRPILRKPLNPAALAALVAGT